LTLEEAKIEARLLYEGITSKLGGKWGDYQNELKRAFRLNQQFAAKSEKSGNDVSCGRCRKKVYLWLDRFSK
jgi:hypothetical protein